MPNRRGQIDPGTDIETAHPWQAGRFAEAEPQDRRGAPGSRDQGQPAEPREQHSADEYSGVNPLGPIDPAMPWVKPGDQAG